MKKIVVIIMTAAAIFVAGCSSPTSKEVSEMPAGYVPRVHMACE